MAEQAVITAVETRLAALGLSGVTIIDINSEAGTPQDGSPFIVLQFPLSGSDQMTLGRYYREEGGFRVVISIQRGLRENLAQGLIWASQIAAHFRTKKFDGVETQAPSSARIDDDNDDGNYFVFAVAVPYTYNFRG